MGILEETIKELKVSEIDQQVRELCDIITQEERGGREYIGPDGPNTFLSLLVSMTGKMETYMTLEREQPETYIICVWTRNLKNTVKREDAPLKRIKVWPSKENKAAKIVRSFAEKMQFVKGK